MPNEINHWSYNRDTCKFFLDKDFIIGVIKYSSTNNKQNDEIN